MGAWSSRMAINISIALARASWSLPRSLPSVYIRIALIMATRDEDGDPGPIPSFLEFAVGAWKWHRFLQVVWLRPVLVDEY